VVVAGAAAAMFCLGAYVTAPAAAAAPSANADAGAPSLPTSLALPTPLATSVPAGGGTWATVAMGDLGQPLNTFWQLLFRPNGTNSWSDRVEATAVATNGGLVLASGPGSLVVGVRPSNDLTFSPLIATSNDGRAWSNGLLNQGLASRPQALAAGPGGAALAIVDGRGGAKVLRNTEGLSAWQVVTTGRTLASSPSSRACGPYAITSVGYLLGHAVIGTSCARGGKAGIFIKRGGVWQLAGPPLGSRPGRAEVLGILPSSGGLAVLLGLTGATGPRGGSATRAGTTLIAAWASAKGAWRTSGPLALGRDGHVVSFGATPAGGVFVVIAGSDGKKELAVAREAGAGARAGAATGTAAASGAEWSHLPAPPQATATVAYLPGGTVDALAVSKTVLTVWVLAPGSAQWVKGQVLDVPVQFGSSS
jgi:hypothetical protein